MKAPLVPLGCLVAFTVCANAQYFSAGWTPGQPASTEEPSPPASTFVPAPKKTTSPLLTLDGLAGLFDISNLLTLEPVASLFASVGINITEKVALQKANFWDERVPLITDDNYADLIVNESLSAQEEQDRVWFIVMYVRLSPWSARVHTYLSSVTASKQEGISKFLDNVFDAAYNETQVAGDLPNVRWGRIDYLNVTAITTKWAIWQCVLPEWLDVDQSLIAEYPRAPYLVVLKDRGQTLRFYKPHHLRLRESALREFLRVDGWKVTEPWATAYAPGGDM